MIDDTMAQLLAYLFKVEHRMTSCRLIGKIVAVTRKEDLVNLVKLAKEITPVRHICIENPIHFL